MPAVSPAPARRASACALVAILASAPAPLRADEGPCAPLGARGDARPTLSGPEETRASADGRFLLHYTREGDDAPTGLADLDADGLPDVLGRALAGLALGDALFPEAGWRPAAPDDGTGGGDAIDVYLRAIDANGYAFHASPATGADAAASCTIHLSATLGDSLPGILESVAVHELHHCVQYAYTTAAPAFLLEATATYEQYRALSSPALAAAIEVLWITRLTQPGRPLASTGGRFEYAGFVLPFFLESFGTPDRARPAALWEHLRTADGDADAALDGASEEAFGQSFARTFLDFATWNAFACARDDAAHYPSDVYPCTIATTSVPVAEPGEGAFALALDQPAHTALYASWPAAPDGRPASLSCTSSSGPGARARARLLVLDRYGRIDEEVQTAARDDEPLALAAEARQDVAGSALLVFVSTGDAPLAYDCVFERREPVEPPADDDDPPGDACACGEGGGAAALAFPLLPLAGAWRRARRGGRPG